MGNQNGNPHHQPEYSNQIDAVKLPQKHELYKYLNTVAEAVVTFMYAVRQNMVLIPRAKIGTPRLSVLAMKEGAEP